MAFGAYTNPATPAPVSPMNAVLVATSDANFLLEPHLLHAFASPETAIPLTASPADFPAALVPSDKTALVLLFLRPVAVSGAATHVCDVSFQSVRYDLFMRNSILILFKKNDPAFRKATSDSEYSDENPLPQSSPIDFHINQFNKCENRIYLTHHIQKIKIHSALKPDESGSIYRLLISSDVSEKRNQHPHPSGFLSRSNGRNYEDRNPAKTSDQSERNV